MHRVVANRHFSCRGWHNTWAPPTCPESLSRSVIPGGPTCFLAIQQLLPVAQFLPPGDRPHLAGLVEGRLINCRPRPASPASNQATHAAEASTRFGAFENTRFDVPVLPQKASRSLAQRYDDLDDSANPGLPLRVTNSLSTFQLPPVAASMQVAALCVGQTRGNPRIIQGKARSNFADGHSTCCAFYS